MEDEDNKPKVEDVGEDEDEDKGGKDKKKKKIKVKIQRSVISLYSYSQYDKKILR